MINFDLPTHQKSIIKVIGVGGGGSNAVNHMYNLGIKDVEFVICNTDAQALKSSPVPNKLQVGIHLTEGLGAGANPEVGKNAAIESKEEIRELLGTETKMVFITAGMGGGTGTGAAPVIAQVAKELGILTVGIVTLPFVFEGRKKVASAQEGIDALKESCDTVLVILNDKLREVYGNLSIKAAFGQADDVLTTAAKSIAEIITVTNEVNVDFQDVRTVMKDSGAAVLGSAVVAGENRARRAAEEAISSPLLNNTDIRGARNILLSMTYGEEEELTMDELTEITDYIQERAGSDADVIWGQGLDNELGNQIRVTVIATGFTAEKKEDTERRVYDLDSNKQISDQKEKESGIQFDRPTTSQEDVQEESNNSEPTVRSNERETWGFSATPNESDNEEDTYFKLDSEFTVTNVASELPQTNQGMDPVVNEFEEERMKLQKQSEERLRRLKELSNQPNSELQDFKEKLDVPAYKRRNIQLKDVPHSSEQNISKFNLNDDNEILGNNKFLHDNVD